MRQPDQIVTLWLCPNDGARTFAAPSLSSPFLNRKAKFQNLHWITYTFEKTGGAAPPGIAGIPSLRSAPPVGGRLPRAIIRRPADRSIAPRVSRVQDDAIYANFPFPLLLSLPVPYPDTPAPTDQKYYLRLPKNSQQARGRPIIAENANPGKKDEKKGQKTKGQKDEKKAENRGKKTKRSRGKKTKRRPRTMQKLPVEGKPNRCTKHSKEKENSNV